MNKRIDLNYKRIDVKENEKEVLEYLHSKGIFERSEILSPAKDIWFKFQHYIRFIDVPVGNRPTFHWLCYVYTSKNDKYQGEVLENITLDEFKTYIDSISVYKKYKHVEKE